MREGKVQGLSGKEEWDGVRKCEGQGDG